MSERLRDRLAGAGWLAGWRLSRMLPERIVVSMFERFALRGYRRNVRRRAVVTANLAPALGSGADVDAGVREAFRWYGRYWAETFRMQDLSDAELDRRFKPEGIEHLANAYAAGTGAVFAVPHVGNWDSGGRWVAARWPLTVVVEVLRPRSLFDRFVAHRRALGMTIVPLERGTDPTAQCIARVRAGEFVALVADRDLSGSGIEVEMFGRRTTMPAGPAVIALRTGAPLIAAAVYQAEDGTWPTIVLPPLSSPDPSSPDAIAVLTQRLATAFEGLIARAPSQWHVFFSRYWIDEPPA